MFMVFNSANFDDSKIGVYESVAGIVSSTSFGPKYSVRIGIQRPNRNYFQEWQSGSENDFLQMHSEVELDASANKVPALPE